MKKKERLMSFLFSFNCSFALLIKSQTETPNTKTMGRIIEYICVWKELHLHLEFTGNKDFHLPHKYEIDYYNPTKAQNGHLVRGWPFCVKKIIP